MVLRLIAQKYLKGSSSELRSVAKIESIYSKGWFILHADMNVKIKAVLRSVLIFTLLTFFLSTPQMASAAACSTPAQSTVTESGVTYTVQTFTAEETNCTWSIPAGVISVELFIVGGGGGAGFGNCGGGGGAGRVIVSNTPISVSPGLNISLTVGSGGNGGFVSGTDWRAGSNGSASSVTISTNAYSASGGGGGGGGTSFNGSTGGSGGGGTACGTVGTGGGRDNSAISGFTTFANTGIAGSGSGGGGGGAGAAAYDSKGGPGRIIWGVMVAAGGGGWNSGSGGSFIGGNSYSGSSTKADSGTPGTSGTGSGGGGGNDGGSGRVAIRYTVDTTAPTFTSASTFSAAENITTSANAAVIRVSESATITISSGVDAARFNIITSDSVTAFIRFKVSPDFEAPTDTGANNVYNLTITATDAAANSGTQSITITVTDVVDTSSFNSLLLAGSATSATYRTSIVVTANVTVASKVTFRVNGKKLPGCINKLASGSGSSFSVTCNWRPSNRGQVSLTAAATPTGAGISSATSNPVNVMVANKVGSR